MYHTLSTSKMSSWGESCLKHQALGSNPLCHMVMNDNDNDKEGTIVYVVVSQLVTSFEEYLLSLATSDML